MHSGRSGDRPHPPAGRPAVTAAVVNYNTRTHLDRCLASLATEPVDEVLAVDNASSDGSVAFVREHHPAVRLIENRTNSGYAAAANQALMTARSTYLLLLNSDTVVQPGTVARLAAHLEAHPGAAIAAPAILDETGALQPSCFPFPGTGGWLLENEPVARWTRRVPAARRRSVSFRAAQAPRPVPWVLGAAMLLRRDAVLAIGGLDEAYFMYYEEVDLCRRLAIAGRETHYVPEAIVVHTGGASTSQQRSAMLVRRYQSTLRYYDRHLTSTSRLVWRTLVRIKWAALLIRDSARLLVARDAERRRQLLEQRRAYRELIFRTASAGDARDAGANAGR